MVGIFEAIKKGFGMATKALGLVSILIGFNLIGNLISIPLSVAPGQIPTPEMTLSAIAFIAIFMLISVFIQGGTLGLIRDNIKEGRMKLASFASYGAKYYLKLLGLGALILLIIAIVAVIASVLIAVTAPLSNVVISGIAIAIAITIGVIASLFYFIPFALSPYALVCEGLGVIASMKRGLEVAKKPFARVFSLILLFVVLMLISLGIGVIFGFIVGLISSAMSETAGKILMAIVTSIINGYLGIVMTGSFMVFYLGLAAQTEKKII